MFGWATQIAKTAVSEAASLGKAYVDTVIGENESEEEYYARIARERETHSRDEDSRGNTTTTTAAKSGGGSVATAQRIGEMPKIVQPANPTMQTSLASAPSQISPPPATATTATADTMLRHNRFTGGVSRKVGLSKGLGVTRGLAAGPPLTPATATTTANSGFPTFQRADSSMSSSLASMEQPPQPHDGVSRALPLSSVSTPTRTHQSFIPSSSSKKPLSLSSSMRAKREEATTFLPTATAEVVAAEPPTPPIPISSSPIVASVPTTLPQQDDHVHDGPSSVIRTSGMQSQENLNHHDSPTPNTVTPTTPVSSSSFAVVKPPLSSGLVARKPAVARKTGLGLGGGASVKSGLGLGGGGGTSKLGALKAAPTLNQSTTSFSLSYRDEEQEAAGDVIVDSANPTAMAVETKAQSATNTAATTNTANHHIAPPSKAAVSPIWGVLEHSYQHQQGASSTTTITTVKDTYLRAYEALIEVAFLANDDACSPHSLKEVYTKSIGCLDFNYPFTSSTTSTIRMPSTTSLPKMGLYITSLQHLLDTTNFTNPEQMVGGDGVVMMVQTFVASLEAISELAERYDDDPPSGANHYKCIRDALSAQEHTLLNVAVVAKQQQQQRGDGGEEGGVVVPLLVLTQKLLWAM